MAQLDQTLSIREIDSMRMKVLEVLKYVEQNKHRIRSHDRNQISNHLNYTLNTMDNMINIRHVENADPYNQPQSGYKLDPKESTRTVVYNPDGTTKVIDKSRLTTGEGWENQFDESLLLRPPCYTMPPQSLTDIKRIKNIASGQGHKF